MNAVRKTEEFSDGLRLALDQIENVRTLQRTFASLLAAGKEDADTDVRGDLAGSFFLIRWWRREGIIDAEQTEMIRLAIEDALSPSDDLHTVDRAAMAEVFGLMDEILAGIDSQLRPVKPKCASHLAPNPRKPTQANGVVVGLFDSEQEGK